MKRLLILILIIFGLFVFTSGGVLAFFFPSQERKIVVFRENVPDEEQFSILSQHRATFSKKLKLLNAAAIKISSADIERLVHDPKVLRIDPDVQVFALPNQKWCDRHPEFPWCPKPSSTPIPSLTPTPSLAPSPTTIPSPSLLPTPSPSSSTQPLPWGITRIKADQAWSVSRGSGVKVAILDTGINRNHPDLRDNLAGCLNFIFSRKTCEDDNGHGTHVSGIVAAEDNSFGVVGVAPNAKIYALKVLDRRGSGYLSDIIEALDWVITNNVQIVNMSLGTSSDITSFREAVQRVNAAGIIQVAAAGNSGPAQNTVLYPAAYPQVIAVSATDASDNVPSWSSRGGELNLAAPGVNIYSTYLNNSYKTLSGTSMSAPHVTGSVALRLYLRPTETPNQIENILETNINPLPITDPVVVGAGLLDAFKVVSAP